MSQIQAQEIASKINQLKAACAAQTYSPQVIDAVFTDSVAIAAMRQLLPVLIDEIRKFPRSTRIEAAEYVLEKMKMPELGIAIETYSAQVHSLLADAYEDGEDFDDAVKNLRAINLDSTEMRLTPDQKGETLMRIVRLYLEIDNTADAEIYLNRFKQISHQITNQDTLIHFTLSQARIQDARRDFLAAAKGYQDISLNMHIAEEERIHCLSTAVQCAVLAPAGPARSRALKRLYMDERTAQLPSHTILENMFLTRLIDPKQVSEFAETLAPHQLARTASGSTVLVQAMNEHNLLACSKLYANISFDDLGELLNVDDETAQGMASSMIWSGRLMGRLDEIDRFVYFEAGEASGEAEKQGDMGGAREVRRWDANVKGLLEEVEVVTTSMQNAMPEFVARYLVI